MTRDEVLYRRLGLTARPAADLLLSAARLRRLAAHVETLPPARLNMKYWCGTACCITGHACTIFPDLLRCQEGEVIWFAGSPNVKYEEAFAHAFALTHQEACDHTNYRLSNNRRARARDLRRLARLQEERAEVLL